jgi:hypothetical protein
MLKHHLHNRPNLRTAGGGGNPWLFPSSHPGKHIDPQSIMHRLRDLGINLLGASNSALQNLVAAVPLRSSPNYSVTATKSPSGTQSSRHSHGPDTSPSGIALPTPISCGGFPDRFIDRPAVDVDGSNTYATADVSRVELAV